jgi:hypothetical protein
VNGLRALGLNITISRHSDLTAPAYRGVVKREFARPAE